MPERKAGPPVSTRYEINIKTNNPDFIARLQYAVESAMLHIDFEDKVCNLSLNLLPVDSEGRTGDPIWATDDEALVAEHETR